MTDSIRNDGWGEGETPEESKITKRLNKKKSTSKHQKLYHIFFKWQKNILQVDRKKKRLISEE